jgi:hypothetical protein
MAFYAAEQIFSFGIGGGLVICQRRVPSFVSGWITDFGTYQLLKTSFAFALQIQIVAYHGGHATL